MRKLATSLATLAILCGGCRSTAANTSRPAHSLKRTVAAAELATSGIPSEPSADDIAAEATLTCPAPRRTDDGDSPTPADRRSLPKPDGLFPRRWDRNQRRPRTHPHRRAAAKRLGPRADADLRLRVRLRKRGRPRDPADVERGRGPPPAPQPPRVRIGRRPGSDGAMDPGRHVPARDQCRVERQCLLPLGQPSDPPLRKPTDRGRGRGQCSS